MKRKPLTRSALAFILLLGILAACAAPAVPAQPTQPEPSVSPTKAVPTFNEPLVQTTRPPEATLPVQTGLMPLAVNLTWHMHQPFYYKSDHGVYSRPWVRVHATKDYLDMAELIARYPGMKATINITPSLIEQLNDYTVNGAKDTYWVLAEKPAAELSDADKDFIIRHFYDVNWDHIIARFPRYQELLNKRGGTDETSIARALESFTEEDWRDLQIWFNLAWVDPGYLAMDPFKALVAKGRAFTEEDKVPLFRGILDLMKRVLPTYKDLQAKGILEITTTPYAHPILPLIADIDQALVGNPQAIMPQSFREQGSLDADAHLNRAVEIYQQAFGSSPTGLWPGEGAVSEEIIPGLAANGFSYLQTGEPVLVRSLGLEGERFDRDENGTVVDVNTVYKPYLSPKLDGKQLPIFFRDWDLSDKIGFDYASMPGKDAARDLISRLEAIQAETTGADKIVSIIVDGENCWENYDMDGKEFLTEFYQRLSSHSKLQPTTPSDYLKSAVNLSQLDTLFPGAWFSPNYDTWIGEREEAEAWELLARTRNFLAEYQQANQSTMHPPSYAQAMTAMLQAEGSDWFWWYGTDQDSGQDAYFDQAYRELLKQVYLSLQQPVPEELDVPIIQAPSLKPSRSQTAILTPAIDGETTAEEWQDAALFKIGQPAPLKEFYYGVDEENLYLRVDLPLSFISGHEIELYLRSEDFPRSTITPLQGDHRLASGANLAFLLKESAGSAPQLQLAKYLDSAWVLDDEKLGSWAVSDGKSVEISLPLTALGTPEPGAILPLQLLLKQDFRSIMPVNTSFELRFMHFGPVSSILEVSDPPGDDKGPGSYTYPKDNIFIPGVFDLTHFSVGSDGANLIFSFAVKGPITNGWNSPSGYSVQTFDVYIDKDPGEATGERLLLPGRNAALPKDNGWEYALWAEAWMPKIVQASGTPGKPSINEDASATIKQIIDTNKNAVVVMVPLETFGEGDPATWAYAATVTGQEGYPSEGVWRIRDVRPSADQYKFGGGTGATNEPRIIDFARPAGMPPEQYPSLNSFKPSKDKIGAIPVDDFAVIPMLLANTQ